MDKKTLRQLYRSKRSAIPAKDRMKWDDLLLIQFQRLDISGIQTILSYWPMANQHEPNTQLFTRYLVQCIPSFTLCYPVTDSHTHQMTAWAIDENTDFKENSLGISEPMNGIEVPAEKIDMVLIPLLAFDLQGFRVGFGKGYYDRYLATCSENCLRIGFSYFDPIDKISDTNDFDVPLNFCITPYQTYEF